MKFDAACAQPDREKTLLVDLPYKNLLIHGYFQVSAKIPASRFACISLRTPL